MAGYSDTKASQATNETLLSRHAALFCCCIATAFRVMLLSTATAQLERGLFTGMSRSRLVSLPFLSLCPNPIALLTPEIPPIMQDAIVAALLGAVATIILTPPVKTVWELLFPPKVPDYDRRLRTLETDLAEILVSQAQGAARQVEIEKRLDELVTILLEDLPPVAEQVPPIADSISGHLGGATVPIGMSEPSGERISFTV